MFIILLGPPLIFFLFSFALNGEGYIPFLIITELPLILAYLEKAVPKWTLLKKAEPWIRFTTYTILLIFFLAYILLIPEAVYLGWLKLLSAGRAAGTVSMAFIIPLTLFTSMGSSWLILWKRKVQAALILGLLISMVWIIMYPGILSLAAMGVIFIILILNQTYRGSRLKVTLYGSILIVTAALLAAIMPIQNERPRGSKIINMFSNGLHSGILKVYPEFPLAFSVPGFGYSYQTRNISGDPPLLSSKPLFTIKGTPGSLLYFRTEISRKFNRTGWVFTLPVDPVTQTDMVSNKEDNNVISQEAMEQIRVIVEADLFTRLPLTPNTAKVKIRDQFFWSDGIAMMTPPDQLPLTKGEEIILFQSHTLKESKNMAETQLQIVGKLPGAIENLGRELNRETDVETLSAIRNYLKNQYTYTLSTTGSTDPISDFLFTTHQGYCLHFASSAALLAKANGIPIRIARGFVTLLPSEEEARTGETPGKTTITGYSAHLWPEILNNQGQWIPWEVTPPMIDLAPHRELGDLDDLSQLQLSHMGLAELESFSVTELPAKFSPPPISLIILALTILTAAIAGTILWRKRRLENLMLKLIRKNQKQNQIAPPSKEGWNRWTREMTAIQPAASAELGEFNHLMHQMNYSPWGVSPFEKKNLVKIISKLMKK